MWGWMFLLSLFLREVYHAVADPKALFCYFMETPYFGLKKIDPEMCNYMAFAFASIDPDTNKLQVRNPYIDLKADGGAYRLFNQLKRKNPKLKTLLSIGGGDGGSIQYSRMAADPRKRAIFIESVMDAVRTFGFDGIDMDWEFPEAADKVNYVVFLRQLKSQQEDLILTAAVCATKECVDRAYNVEEIADILTFIIVLTFDLRTWASPFTSHHSALYELPKEKNNEFYPGKLRNTNFSINYWIEKGADPEQILLGIGLYGYKYKLRDSKVHGLYAPASKGGIWTYSHFCSKLATGGWEIFRNRYVVSPYAFKGKQWFCYDDPESAKEKAEYIREMGLGGAAVWSVAYDDYEGICGEGKNPIQRQLHDSLIGNKPVE